MISCEVCLDFCYLQAKALLATKMWWVFGRYICLTKKRGNCKATTFQLPDIIRQNERQIGKMHYAVAQLVLVVALVVSVVIISISIPLHCL